MESNQIELTLKEVEVIKLSAKPGDVLFFKLKGDQFTNYDVDAMGSQLRKLFPNNKVVVLALPDGHEIELTTMQTQDTVEEVKDCSKPTDYCNSCGCGKKERIEAERAKGEG